MYTRKFILKQTNFKVNLDKKISIQQDIKSIYFISKGNSKVDVTLEKDGLSP